METISFVTEDGTIQEFAVVEETRFGGVNYLLVCDAQQEDEDESQGYIMKDISDEQDTQACYVFVEDDKELEAVLGIFEDLLADSDYSLEQQ